MRTEPGAPGGEPLDEEDGLQQLGVALDRVGVQSQAGGDGLVVEQARGLGGEQSQQARNGVELERVGDVSQIAVERGIDVVAKPGLPAASLSRESLGIAAGGDELDERLATDGASSICGGVCA